MDGMQEITADLAMGSVVLRLVFAMFTGMLVGIERSSKGRGAAGVKTHALVCVGAALVMLTSEYLRVTYNNQGDLARLGAQVISGIGFLGAGTIMVTGRNHVKGLTTAAGLWVCGVEGLAIGIGFWEGAVITLIVVMVILQILSRVDLAIHQRARSFELYIEFNTGTDVRKFMEDVSYQNVHLSSVEVTKSRIDGSRQAAVVEFEMRRGKDRPGLIEWIRERKYILYVEEM